MAARFRSLHPLEVEVSGDFLPKQVCGDLRVDLCL
jgi:hypothetical protein